jgi:Legionella pneumophila major outer membrane protein precursor
MKSIIKLAFIMCLGSTAAMVSRPAIAATAEQISARLDALEKENAALRARVNHLETSRAAKPQRRDVESNPGLAMSRPQLADTLAADTGYAVKAIRPNSPHFEVSASLNFMQPGAGNLEYGTLITPLPAVTPSWANQSLTPDYSPSFDVGARYMASEANDIAINWTHQTNTANASVFATPLQMVGPPFLIGPESALYKIGHGNVQTAYDAINLDAGHTFCAECSFQLRAFGGVEVARIGQNLTGTFQSPDGTAFNSNTTTSSFTGAGPRLGMKGQYAFGDFQFIGETAGAALIGPAQSRINFTTLSPALAGINSQSLTSPNATRVIPSIDARLAVAYTFAPSNYGLLKVEAGYRAAVYFDAVNQYALTNVPTALTLPPNGIYLATAQHLQTNFTDQGPYLKASWLFW